MARKAHWFLGAIESLRGKRRIRDDAIYTGDPEAIRDAKGAVSRFMPPETPYVARADQPALSAQFDLREAYRRASSFRKLVRELCRILIELGHQPVVPADWRAG